MDDWIQQNVRIRGTSPAPPPFPSPALLAEDAPIVERIDPPDLPAETLQPTYDG